MLKKQRELKSRFLQVAASNVGCFQKRFCTPTFYNIAITLATVFLCSSAYLLLTQIRSRRFMCFLDNPDSLSSRSFFAFPQSSAPNSPLDDPNFSVSRNHQGKNSTPTSLENIVFGIGAAAKTWSTRGEYIKQWWRPTHMRGFVWLDKPLKNCSHLLPPCKVSADTSQFPYTNEKGPRSAIRIARIVTETFRLGLPHVHWFVMGDDDTFFVVENLIKVLSKYDQSLFYYIGSSSETHQQNLDFSYNMAFGGGGFAVSYSLAKAFEKIQDDCIQRYPSLYGSDERIQACMAELGVPLTKEPGFHQFDIQGDPSGFLAAHPLTPFITMHHLDKIDPLFPNMSRLGALRHLSNAIQPEPGGIFQQSICYDKAHNVSISMSWGYAVQIFRGIVPPRELEVPSRTFSTWRRSRKPAAYTFSTRSYPREICEAPVQYYLRSIGNGDSSHVFGNYLKYKVAENCGWMHPILDHVEQIHVVKERLADGWFEVPRRQCCQVSDFGKSFMKIHVKNCKEGQVIL